MTILDQNLDVKKDRIQITRVTENGITYVSPDIYKEKLGFSKWAVIRVFELLGVSCVYIGTIRFYDETMANLATDAWINKTKYIKIGMSTEFEKLLNSKNSETN